jgi:hypothetical protein
MTKTTSLWELIGEAKMAVQRGQQHEVLIDIAATHVRVWRQGPGIEGIKVEFLRNS